MKIVIDIEADALVNPKNIWLIVCKDIDTDERFIFKNVTANPNEFVEFSSRVSMWIGHNLLGYDLPVISNLLQIKIDTERTTDTLILSKLIDYSRQGHSIEDYGLEFGIPKGKFVDFSKYSQEMEDYCVRDVDICHRIYLKYLRYISNPLHVPSITLEHQFQLVVNGLHVSGFSFNSDKAGKLLSKVEADLAVLDKDILEAFPPKLRLIREITPKETKHGTLAKTDFRWLGDGDLSEYNGGAFCRCMWQSFNPASHKQIVSVLSDAGWRPTERTQSHIEVERSLNRLRYARKGDNALDITKKELIVKLEELKKTGWRVNEANLETLPSSAPKAARLLAQRIMLEARRRSLTEWLDLVWHVIELEHGPLGILGTDTSGTLIQNGETSSEPRINGGVKTTSKNLGPATVSPTLKASMDCPSKMLLEWLKSKKVDVLFAKENANSTSITVIGRGQLENFFAALATVHSVGTKNTPPKYKVTSQRIHGKFNGIGAWSHRMNHQAPNTANIPNEFDTAGKKKLLGKELRSLWQAPRNRLLVGVDAEGIQLRIFAHLINDVEFTKALVEGRKDDKTDPHSLNQRILGSCCKTRQAAKRFIYALLLGAGLGKLSQILETSESETQSALDRLIERYAGFALLKQEVIPKDAERGWFYGLDGRKVRIPGDTTGGRKHLAMSGYLQNGEAVVMKLATLKWVDKLKEYDALLVNFVHDEWQVEGPNNMTTALLIANMMSSSLESVGRDLQLNCPLAGSFYNDDNKDYTIATNWASTH